MNRLRTSLFRSRPLQSAAGAVVATSLAFSLSSVAPATFTALDWSLYDAAPRSAPVSPSILLLNRDRTSEARFGTGPWDPALLAKFIAAAHEAGAAAIGIDVPLGEPSPPHLGGAVSDALLNEAVRDAGNVVFATEAREAVVPTPNPLPLDMQSTAAVGHFTVSPDADHIVRSMPLFVVTGGRPVPAFGFALASMLANIPLRGMEDHLHLPIDRQGRLLLNYSASASRPSVHMISFDEAWEAMQAGGSETLHDWMKDKVVLMLARSTTPQDRHLIPDGSAISASLLQARLLNTVLTQSWGHRLSTPWQVALALVLAGATAWILLGLRSGKGIAAIVALLIGYPAIVLAAATAGWMLPVILPLVSSLVVAAGTAVWAHVSAGQRVLLMEQHMLRVQQELAAVRGALAVREDAVDALKEDLEAARTAVAQSTGRQEELSREAGILQARIAEAQAQEEAARQRLESLSRELEGLRSVAGALEPMGDTELERLREECGRFGIVTRDRQVIGLFRDLKRGAKTALPALLLGEPGTGKELFARAIHRLSPRSAKPFIAVNMAAVSPELFESELFGHVRGSFTGATADRRGYFELANHGTIFLDEIGDLRLDHQGKLLRVLQEKSFYRIGATTPTTVDVRIVAATNRDLQRGVSEGWFREDLYFRLKGLVFRLPPLRERTEDVALLAQHSMTEASRGLGKPVPQLAQDALRLLERQLWRGNVRELRQCLEQAVALSDGPLITARDLRLQPDEPVSAVRTAAALPDQAGDASVLACLRDHGFDMQATAKSLGWDRSTVTQRLKGLCFQALVEANGDQRKAAASIAGDPALVRTVELKLADYYSHLLASITPFAGPDDAVSDCKRRFKNLPERHFRSVEALVRQHFS